MSKSIALPKDVENALNGLTDSERKKLTEIRLRVDKPVLVYIDKTEYGIVNGRISHRDGYVFTQKDADILFQKLCDGAPFACIDNQKECYITVDGSRVGFLGDFVAQNGEIKHITNVRSFCIRIFHEAIGCALPLYKFVFDKNCILNTLAVSPPGAGKTTLLRDFARICSNDGFSVCIADEREEIAPHCAEVGKRTDVIANIKKSVAINNCVRALRPDVIVADELGNADDIRAVKNAITEGVSVICSAHGKSLDDVKKRIGIGFDRYIVLSDRNGAGTVEGIFDFDGVRLL